MTRVSLVRTAGRGTLLCAVVAVALGLSGCRLELLDPHGPIGTQEKLILIDSTVIMLAIVIPVIIATLAFAWWFREGNPRARRLPHWHYSGQIEFVVWAIPALVILFLGSVAWVSSHDLDPPKEIPSPAQPLDVQVVALDWKWLFIYPGEGVASVNRLVVPVGTPLRFLTTSAGPMNVFFIPQIGSQIYSMAGMATRVNLLVDDPGTYRGLSANFSGAGFSDMKFDVVALPKERYQEWVDGTRSGGGVLDAAAYAALVRPSEREPARTFGAVSAGLFDAIVAHPGAPPSQAQIEPPPPPATTK